MAAFLVCLIACLVAGVGSRMQRLAAALAQRFRAGPALFVAALLAAFLAAAAAAWASRGLSAAMTGQARGMLVGVALMLAGGSMLFPARVPGVGSGRLGAAPTAFLLLLVQCLLDGGAFLVTAASAYWQHPALAALGGGAGMFGTAAAGLLLADTLAALPLRRIAMAAGGLFLLIGAAVIASVR